MLRQAVILVGGLGTRLGELTRALPKPMVDVAGRPFLEYLIDELSRYPNFREVLLLAGYLGQTIADRYDGRSVRGLKIRVLTEPAPMGTGGALKFAQGNLDERFLLVNGDSFFDFNIADMLLRAREIGAPVHLVLNEEIVGDRYGRVDLDGGLIRGFINPGTVSTGPINAGLYVIERAVLDRVPRAKFSLEQDLLPDLAKGGELAGTAYRGYFIDIGIPADLARAQTELVGRLTRPAVFFDRDGVLNVDKGYVHRPDQFEWMPEAREAIKACNDANYFAFVVTNQAGIARGYYGPDAVVSLHDWMNVQLMSIGAHIDAFQYCPYHAEGVVAEYASDSDRRKPNPGMLLDCLEQWPVRREGSFLIGDRDSDIEAARRAGVPGYLYEGGSLLAAVKRRIGT